MANEKEIARLLKEALKIVDELGKFEPNELIALDEYELEPLEELIERAQKLKKNRLWKLT